MHRSRLLVLPGLLAVGLYLLLSNFNTAGSSKRQSESAMLALNFDGYAEGISTVLYDPSGVINYTLQAERQIHFNDDSTELQSPQIELYQDGNSRWHIMAESGKISPEIAVDNNPSRIIVLSGKVEVVSLDKFGNRMLMSTETLMLDPAAETLSTDQRVTLLTSNIEHSAIGMYADLTTDEILFQSEIRGSYADITD